MKKLGLMFLSLMLLTSVGFAQMIEDGKNVSIHYTLTVDGEAVESSEGKDPLKYEHGKSLIIPGLEKELSGLKVGDKKIVVVKPEDGYGPVLEEGFKEIEKSRMPQDGPELQPGLVLEMVTPEGQSIPTIIEEVKEDVVLLNFNHPLAGKTLQFDVEVVSVE